MMAPSFSIVLFTMFWCSTCSFRTSQLWLRPRLFSLGSVQSEGESDPDYIVIGSGIGGLSAGSLLSWYGYNVLVLESHYLPGGVAHTFEYEGFKFDAGPSLWNGMNKRPYNPLREIMEIIGEGNTVKYSQYDGWVMHTPDGTFKFKVGKDEETGEDNFIRVIQEFGGDDAVKEWKELNKVLEPIKELAGAVPPLALRNDNGVLITLLPHLGKLIKGAAVASKVENSFKSISQSVIKNRFLDNWFEFLSFALSGLPADGTIAAAVAYTMRDLHQKGAALDYPIGGSAAVIDALVRGIEKRGGKLRLRTHVEEIIVENNKATGVRLRAPSSSSSSEGGSVIRAKKGVISNASVWDTSKLLRGTAVSSGAISASTLDEKVQTPRTNSFVHLHLGIDATGLPADLESHYSVINSWDSPIDSSQNHVIISIPSVLDPSLAPPNCHVIHAYAAANEPYELYDASEDGDNDRAFSSREAYKAFKEERCEFLYRAIERSIPDLRNRIKVNLTGSPLTHKRFNRRFKGTYGPAWSAGKEKFPFPKDVFNIDGLSCCGDSIFPGIGVPAVAASGANAANSAVSVFEHLKLLNVLYAI